MTLSTFGAVMGFAAELAKQAGDTYKALALKAKENALRETLEALSEEEGKNHVLMIRARRENVTEMILEPVSGLQREDYEVDLRVPEQREDTELIKAALILEEREKKFFQDASAKIPLPEVARLFRKMAQAKEESVQKLQLLGLDRTLANRS